MRLSKMVQAHREYCQVCRERLNLKKYEEVYYPFRYLYWGFEERLKKKDERIRREKNRLEWFAILVFGAVAILILLTDKGVMR